jgi:hypothetical protein
MKTTIDEANARLEEAALVLEGMAKELRRLKTDGGKGSKSSKGGGKAKVAADAQTSGGKGAVPDAVKVGQRVCVVRKDQYRGRTGVVLGRHGRLFWDVRLDASATQPECTIYKRESSLKVVEAPQGTA